MPPTNSDGIYSAAKAYVDAWSHRHQTVASAAGKMDVASGADAVTSGSLVKATLYAIQYTRHTNGHTTLEQKPPAGMAAEDATAIKASVVQLKTREGEIIKVMREAGIADTSIDNFLGGLDRAYQKAGRNPEFSKGEFERHYDKAIANSQKTSSVGEFPAAAKQLLAGLSGGTHVTGAHDLPTSAQTHDGLSKNSSRTI